MRKAVREYHVVRLAVAAAVAAAVMMFVVFHFAPGFKGGEIDPGTFVRDFPGMRRLPPGWSFEGRDETAEGGVRLRFAAGGVKTAELFFVPLDAPGRIAESYARTEYFNFYYRAGRALTRDEDRFLGRMAGDVLRAEAASAAPRRLEIGTKRLASFLLVVFLLLTLLVFDLTFAVERAGRGAPAEETGGDNASGLDSRERGNDREKREQIKDDKKINTKRHEEKTKGHEGEMDSRFRGNDRISLPEARRGGRAYGALCAALVLLILAVKIRNNPWEYCNSYAFMFFPGGISNVREFLDYALGDFGFPAVPYRALLALLAPARDIFLIRSLVFLFALMSLFVTWRLARRLVRESLAWMAPVLFFGMGVIDFGLEDLRGYFFFTFFGIFSVWLFGELIGKPRPAVLFLWVASNYMAFTANPICITLAAGPAVYCFFVRRKTLPPPARRTIDIHFGFLAAGFVCFAPFVHRAFVSAHTGPPGGASGFPAVFLTGFRVFMLASAASFFAAAIYFRRDIRGALFFSAFCATGATLFALSAGVLGAYDYYFLFAMPLNVVCLVILAESLVRAVELRNRNLGAALWAAAAAVLIAAVLWVDGRALFFTMGTHEKIERSISILDERVGAEKEYGTPVYIFPHEFFVYYVSHRFGIDVFSRNPLTHKALGFQHRWKDLPTGDVRLQAGRFYNVVPAFVQPETLEAGPFLAVVFGHADDPVAVRKSECLISELSERYGGIGLLIKYCRPAPRPGTSSARPSR